MGDCASKTAIEQPQEVEIWQADVGQRWAVGPAQASERKDALAGGKRGAARWRHPAGTAADDTMGARPSSDSCRPSSKQREDGKAVRSALMQQPGRLSLDSCYDGSTLEDLCCSPLSEDGFSPLSQDGLIQQDDALALTAFSDSSAWHVEAGFSATSADDALQGQRFVSEPEDVAATMGEVQLGGVIGRCARTLIYGGTWRNQAVAVTATDHALPDGLAAVRLLHAVRHVMCSPRLEHPSLARVHFCAVEWDTSSGWGEGQCCEGSLHGGSDGVWARHCQGASSRGRQLLVWTVSERSDLGSLDAALRLARLQRQPPRLPAILHTAHEVASGLHHLHTHHLAHGQLSSASVLLCSAPDDARGFAAKISSTSYLACQAARRSCGDTPRMDMLATTAPEVALAGEAPSPASDAYSLGVLLWEMYAGQPAWGLRPAQVMRDLVRQRPALPLLAGCPPAFQELVSACTHPQAAARPAFPAILASLQAMLAQA